MTKAIEQEVESALAWLKKHSSKANRDGMARFAIPSDHALGVAMRDIKALGKKLGRQPFRVAVSDFCAGKNLLEKR